MHRVLILGSNGMLGSTILKVFSTNSEIETVGSTRHGSIVHGIQPVALNVTTQDVNEFISEQKEFDFIINCIGLISHKIIEPNLFSVRNAIDLNTVLPYKLAMISKKSRTKIIQIATDCVFSGQQGPYFEDSLHQPLDIYGISKSAGEVDASGVLNLRCSIVGKELISSYSLMNWILNHDANKKIHGFVNHKWNGISTYAYSKIILGLILNDKFFSGIQHIVPSNLVSKYELISQFNKLGRQGVLNINKHISDTPIDRQLGTRFPSRNEQLWKDGGYSEIPTIQSMIEEYFRTELGGISEFRN